MKNLELNQQITDALLEYARYSDKASRTTVRVQVLRYIEKLKLSKSPVQVRVVSEKELSENSALRGALLLHLDFSSRSTLTTSELLFTASVGRVLIAEHSCSPGFPFGVCLLLPSAGLPAGRGALFSHHGEPWDQANYIVSYALATNPGGIGAGKALVQAAQAETGNIALIAYAPLNGMRAQVISIVDDEAKWQAVVAEIGSEQAKILMRQLTDLLARDILPDLIDEPAAGFLLEIAKTFAVSKAYRVGEFHRHLGAELVGIDFAGDPTESDSMWARAYLKY